MKKLQKWMASCVAAAMLCTSAGTVWAYEFPHAFWALADRYQAALDTDNKAEIIAAGSGIISLLEPEEQNEQVQTVLGAKLYDMGYAYEALGGIENHIKAGECFEKYIPYGTALGWADGVKIAAQKAMQFQPELKLFTPTETPQKYFGAANEPEQGVLYGQVSEHFTDRESMILLYLEYGQSTDFTWPKHIFDQARAGGKAVELAVNFPQEGAQLQSIISDTAYINALVDFLKGYTDVPVFLRIGAEVNIWQNKADPAQYIEAFRKVADAVRIAGSNVATVWSVVHTSEWSVDFDDYYPGDAYVDWVGISAYANKYFGARTWPVSESHNPIVYKAGNAADPVLLIRDVVERYGDRKPIMLAECGSAYYTGGEMNEFSADWAVTSLRRMYSMIPIVYPQVKLIAYFNKNMPNESNYYDLEGCAELMAAYEAATQAPWFIQNRADNTVAYSYQELGDTITVDSAALELYAYPHVYGYDVPMVNYYIDGTWVASTAELPYNKKLDLSTYGAGTHTLIAEVNCNGYVALRKDYTLVLNENKGDELAQLSSSQKEALAFCQNAGVISGYEDGTIRPYNTITRAEFASMAARLFGLSSDTPCTFSDAAAHWATNYINACVAAGAIAGMGDGTFAPDAPVTYEQAVKIITSVAGMTDGQDLEALGGYPDAYLAIGSNQGLLSGMDAQQIGAPINRINVAVLLYNTQK